MWAKRISMVINLKLKLNELNTWIPTLPGSDSKAAATSLATFLVENSMAIDSSTVVCFMAWLAHCWSASLPCRYGCPVTCKQRLILFNIVLNMYGQHVEIRRFVFFFTFEVLLLKSNHITSQLSKCPLPFVFYCFTAFCTDLITWFELLKKQ